MIQRSKSMQKRCVEMQFQIKKLMLSILMTLSGMISQARSFLLSAAEPLADAHRTLGFHGTPVENHCSVV